MRLPDTMTALAVPEPGGPDALKPVSRPVPRPKPDEVLIAVEAAGVNRPDVLQREGLYPPPPGAPDVPGLEVSGRIVAVGADVVRFRGGEAVCALLPGGGYAGFAVAHERHVLPAPDGASLRDAAGLPETVFTVWTNVFERGRLRENETLLVHGGSSGIGTTAIQLAKAFGARVIATVGSEEKAQACRALGADHVVLYTSQDFVAETKRVTDGRGADVILDMVGGDYIPRNHEAAAESGRIVQIAFLKASKVEVDFRRLMLKRLTHTGSTLRIRTNDEKAAIAASVERHVWPLVASGAVRPLVHATFPLEDGAKAHALMESSAHIGKILLIPAPAG